MKVGYHGKSDPKKEIVTSGVFPSMNRAIQIFAQMKNLTTTDFLNIYAVVRLGD